MSKQGNAFTVIDDVGWIQANRRCIFFFFFLFFGFATVTTFVIFIVSSSAAAVNRVFVVAFRQQRIPPHHVYVAPLVVMVLLLLLLPMLLIVTVARGRVRVVLLSIVIIESCYFSISATFKMMNLKHFEMSFVSERARRAKHLRKLRCPHKFQGGDFAVRKSNH